LIDGSVQFQSAAIFFGPGKFWPRPYGRVRGSHGLTQDTRSLLIDGTMDAVLNQSPQSAIMNCVRLFTNLRDRRDPKVGVEATRSQVIFRENLP